MVACAKFHWYFRYSLKMATSRHITFFPKYFFELVYSPQFLSNINITLLSNVWSVNIIQTIQRKYTSTVFYVSNLHNRIKSWLIQSICSVGIVRYRCRGRLIRNPICRLRTTLYQTHYCRFVLPPKIVLLLYSHTQNIITALDYTYFCSN